MKYEPFYWKGVVCILEIWNLKIYVSDYQGDKVMAIKLQAQDNMKGGQKNKVL